MGAPERGRLDDGNDWPWPLQRRGYVLIVLVVAIVLVGLWLLGGIIER